jgi:hypothetical protein
MTCTDTITPTHLAKTDGGKETSLSITDIPLSTEMMALGWPKRRWRDHTNLAAGASITSPITQKIRRKCLSVRIPQLQNHPVDFEDVLQWAIRYWLDGPGDRNLVEGEIYRTHPDRHWANPASCTMGTASLSWSKSVGAWR